MKTEPAMNANRVSPQTSADKTTLRPEFGKFGPKHDYRGAHVQMRTPLGRVLLGEIVDVYRDDVRGMVHAKVRHFCGDAWPLEPALSALLILDRSYGQ
jgi:hypothetical protein